jgi:hypothetical protein
MVTIQRIQSELTGIVNGLIEAKAKLQQDVPVKEAHLSDKDPVSKDLARAHEKFKKLLVDLDLIIPDNQASAGTRASVNLKLEPAKILAITCRNAVKEKLDEFQTLILDQVTTGGPLEASCYKEINPAMPEAALVNIGKKIDKVFKEIVKKATNKELIVLIGVKDEKTDQFLFNSKELIAVKTGKPVAIIEVESMQRISEGEVSSLIAEAMQDS